MAISADGHHWHLLNSSPDLRQQILSTPELNPASQVTARHSPIQSITLTNADLDHALGLLLLRECEPLQIFATETVQAILLQGNSFFRMLNRFDGHTRWNSLSPGKRVELGGMNQSSPRTGLFCEAIALPGKAPLYVRGEPEYSGPGSMPVIGLMIEDQSTKRRLG